MPDPPKVFLSYSWIWDSIQRGQRGLRITTHESARYPNLESKLYLNVFWVPRAVVVLRQGLYRRARWIPPCPPGRTPHDKCIPSREQGRSCEAQELDVRRK